MPSRKSIGDATAKSFSAVKRLLKERGITVEAVDGPSQDDAQLRFLQELQQIERALETSAENSATAGHSTWSSALDTSSPAMIDSAAPSDSSKSKKGV